jgi:hypothetical protein
VPQRSRNSASLTYLFGVVQEGAVAVDRHVDAVEKTNGPADNLVAERLSGYAW